MFDLIRSGHLASVKVGGSRRVTEQAIDNYIEAVPRKRGGLMHASQNPDVQKQSRPRRSRKAERPGVPLPAGRRALDRGRLHADDNWALPANHGVEPIREGSCPEASRQDHPV
ncbi:MAG: helix-turn-helix domain-containing protein [Actinomycetota bacterium]|nr:helix-turn-helix domain-containing protein [Actinomycetota bacterium]